MFAFIARQFLIIFLAVVLIVATLLGCATLLPVFLLWRLGAVQLAKVYRPDLHKLVPGSKVLLAYDSFYTKPKLNLAGFLILDDPNNNFDFQKFKEHGQARILKKIKLTNKNGKKGDLVYPELQQYLASFGGYFFWKWDSNFDLNHHLREYDYSGEMALSKREDCICTEEDLQRVFGGLLSMPWIKEKSAWELLYVGKYKSVYEGTKSSTAHAQIAIAFRVHHSLADGYSFLKLLQDLGEGQIVNRPINFPKLNVCQRFISVATFPFKFPYDMARSMVDMVDGPNSWHLYGTKLSREYNSCISKPFPVDSIKAVKNKYGVSYNAVLCAAVAGAYCRMMKEAGQKVPGNVSCVFPFPLPNHPSGLVMHIGGIFAQWPMAAAKSSLERLKIINAGITKSKYFTGHLLYMATGILLGIAPRLCTRLIRNKVFSTVGVSCLPGPDKPLEILGGQITDVLVGAGAGYGKLAGTMVLLSICGKQRFVAHIDKTVFPSEKLFQQLGGYIETELTNMLQVEEEVDVDKNSVAILIDTET